MPTATRALIQFSFLALTISFFVPIGHTSGTYLADSIYTQSTDFQKRDFFIGLFTLIGCAIGIAAARGFYLAWKSLAIKS